MTAEAETPTYFAPAARQAPEQVACQRQALKRSQALGGALDSIPDLVMVLNQQRQIIYANQQLLETLGVDSEQGLLGRRPGEVLACAHAGQMPGGCGTSENCRDCGAALAILASLEGQKSLRECQLLVQDQQGGSHALDLQVWASPLEIEGANYSLLAVADQADHQRRRALERIFFHDVLNTAGSLSGLASLLEEADHASLPALKEGIIMAAEQLLQEITAQRDLMAAENNELSVQANVFSCPEFLRWQVRLATSRAEARGKSLVLELPEGELRLHSDSALLGRVVGNMLKNAFEACAAGQSVTLGLAPLDQGGAEVWVHNPCAMSPEVQRQVFKRSFSTKGKGRGLGAYSMRLLAERYMGGSVGFRSSPEQGTVFWVRLPASLAKSED